MTQPARDLLGCTGEFVEVQSYTFHNEDSPFSNDILKNFDTLKNYNDAALYGHVQNKHGIDQQSKIYGFDKHDLKSYDLPILSDDCKSYSMVRIYSVSDEELSGSLAKDQQGIITQGDWEDKKTK